MEPEKALYFREQFREAREAAQRDAENFDQVIFALENLGAFLKKKLGNGLAAYTGVLTELATHSRFAEAGESQRPYHTPFPQLLDLVRHGRNTAMHEGVFARNLTQHAIQIAIVIEDALTEKSKMKHVSDFMVRNPVCAEIWQPISFIRQNMLAHSFSYLPLKHGNEPHWSLVSDLAIAQYLRGGNPKERLAHTLNALIGSDRLVSAHTIRPNADVDDVLDAMAAMPHVPTVLITDASDQHLLGIVTPFDLL